MPSLSPFRRLEQIRAPIVAPNTWVALVIPPGAVDALVQVEDRTLPFRVSATNTLNAATEGSHAPAGGGITIAGAATEPLTIYVSTPAPTVAIALYQLNP